MNTVLTAHLLSVRVWPSRPAIWGAKPGPVRPLGSYRESGWNGDSKETHASPNPAPAHVAALGNRVLAGATSYGSRWVHPGLVRACAQDRPGRGHRAIREAQRGTGADVGVMRPHPRAPRTLATPAAGPLEGHAPTTPGLRRPTSRPGENLVLRLDDPQMAATC